MFELNTRSTVSESKNFRDILTHYLKYWYLFAAGVVLCLGAAFLYIRYKTVPQYLISSTVLIKDKDKGSSFGPGEAMGDLGLIKASSNIDDQIGIFGSSSLMQKVLDRLDLNVNYQIKGKIRDLNVYWKSLPFYIDANPAHQPTTLPPFNVQPKDSLSFVIKGIDGIASVLEGTYKYGDTLIAGNGQFQVLKNPTANSIFSEHEPVTISFVNTQNLAQAYAGQLEVEAVNTTGSLLGVSLLDAIPERGKDIVLNLIQLYAEESVKYQNQLAIGTIEIIDERLKFLTGEITEVEKDIADYKQENDLTNISSDAAVYLQSAKESSRKLEEYQTQLDILNSLESYIRNGNDESLVPSSLNIQDPTLSGLIAQFNAQQLERKNLLRSTPEDNPLVVNINRSLNNLRSDLLENLKNIKTSLQIALNNERQSASRSRAQIAKVPSAERALLNINRDQSIKQDLYLYLLQKREEEALSLEAPISNTRIVDAPSSTNFPVSPNKTSIYLGALIFGLFIPFAFVYVKDLMNNKVTDIDDVEKITDTPILGQISHDERSNALAVSGKDTTSVAELFRLIRFNLSYLTTGRAHKVILITSGMQGEGKTFFTANLGASLALTGKKVVALSFDLRAPKLLQNLKLKETIGITDYLVDSKWTAKDITVASTNIENFDFIGSGPIPPNPGELMLHPRIETLIDELKAKYDYVLVDSAPVGKVADAFALAPHIDATIFMIRQDYSRKDNIKIVDDIYKNQKLKFPMVVLNDTNAKNSYGYGEHTT
ncbi:polysaccharide biosynthesis tyrosine autokinase [Aurantibacter sp.]|uniref:GumC family protein n=1 Tax=Aurantibacter sp. TaxID=2807103 RepID=UPI003266294B